MAQKFGQNLKFGHTVSKNMIRESDNADNYSYHYWVFRPNVTT